MFAFLASTYAWPAGRFHPPPAQDFADDWQDFEDLEDLLESALEGGTGFARSNDRSALAANGGGPNGSPALNESEVEAKLGEVEALLKAEAASSLRGKGGRDDAAERFEQAGGDVEDVMEAFLGGRGGRPPGHGEGSSGTRPEGGITAACLGGEEERLLEMASALVVLDGLL